MKNCPQCGGALHVEQYDTFTAIHCVELPAHYSEHRRRPGASSLWGNGYHIEPKPEQSQLFGGAA